MDKKEQPLALGLASKLTPATYQQLRTALEIGKWPDGRKLSPEQKENALQLVIAYDQAHHTESNRVGYVGKPEKKEPCGSKGVDGKSGQQGNDEERPLKFIK